MRIFVCVLSGFLYACAAGSFVTQGRVPRVADDAQLPELRSALQRSIRWLATQPGEGKQRFGTVEVGVAEHRAALDAFDLFLADGPDASTIQRYLDAHFVAVRAREPVLFTGYYEPELEGSLAPLPGYDAPIYALPPDLVEVALSDFSDREKGERIVGRVQGGKLVPYYARGAMPASLPVIAWAKDPVDVFFAEIQGSASLRLPDGSMQRIGYAGKNGRPYRAVGGLLIKEGQIKKEEMSMQAIREWLAHHPGDRDRVLRYNESAVFFRLLDTEPIGALGVPVTPGRSVATDLSIMPRAALAFVRFGDTHRLVLNQDTGGAIKGPARVDVFYGRGEDAARIAGHLKEKGELYLLAPKPLTSTR